MRAPATTAMILFQRFYMRRSFLMHDRNVSDAAGFSLTAMRAVAPLRAALFVRPLHLRLLCCPHPRRRRRRPLLHPPFQMIAAAALFVASKVEEVHRRPHAVLEAAHCALHGARRLPYAEQSAEARPLRNELLEAERVLLATLEFDASVEQPYALVKRTLQAWKRETAASGAGAGASASSAGEHHREKRPELAALERAANDILLASCVEQSQLARGGLLICAMRAPPPHHAPLLRSPAPFRSLAG